MCPAVICKQFTERRSDNGEVRGKLRIGFRKIEEIKRKVDCTVICSPHHECLILFVVIAIFITPYNVIFKLSTISLEFDVLILLSYSLFRYFAYFGEKLNSLFAYLLRFVQLFTIWKRVLCVLEKVKCYK